MEKYTKSSMKQAISEKLSLNFGCTVEEATEANMMKACAMVLRDQMSIQAVETRRKICINSFPVMVSFSIKNSAI